METWIELDDLGEPRPTDIMLYMHESCGGGTQHPYPYCPWCSKRITHVKPFENDDYSIKFFNELGFICI